VGGVAASVNDILLALREMPALYNEAIERDRVSRLMACEFAERALPAFELAIPDDNRPRIAIETARHFLNGVASTADLKQAEKEVARSRHVAEKLYVECVVNGGICNAVTAAEFTVAADAADAARGAAANGSGHVGLGPPYTKEKEAQRAIIAKYLIVNEVTA